MKHKLVKVGDWLDAETGEAWELLDCPVCGYQEKVRYGPFRRVALNEGREGLTEEEVTLLGELVRQGREGAEAAARITRRLPRHHYTRVPTERELTALVGEAMRDRAVAEGEPRLSLKVHGRLAAHNS